MSDPLSPRHRIRGTTSRFFTTIRKDETLGDDGHSTARHPVPSSMMTKAATYTFGKKRAAAVLVATATVETTLASSKMTAAATCRRVGTAHHHSAAFLGTPSGAAGRVGNTKSKIHVDAGPGPDPLPSSSGDDLLLGGAAYGSSGLIHKRAASRISASSSPAHNDHRGPSQKKKKAKSSTAGGFRASEEIRTTSFGAVWSGTLDSDRPVVPPHTLILGTHPSRTSLKQQQYYAFPTNAFWWIAGDCLGFRRDRGLTQRGTPYQFCASLRHGPSAIVPYDEQLRIMCQSGFALWDICQSCERPGSSLDSDIVNEIPNPIQEFCRQHPSVRRIVLSNGGTAATIFKRHFADWLTSGELVVADNDERSIQAFRTAPRISPANEQHPRRRRIVLVCAIGVSSAAASFSYEQKRDYWEEFVYQPGLELLSQT